MSGYVYIRFENEDLNWPQKHRINRRLDHLIECVARKHFSEEAKKGKLCTGKAKKYIVCEANRLLYEKRRQEGVKDDQLRVYHRVSFKQIANLRRPMNGYTTCYAGVVLMAIYNLLCDEGGENVDRHFKKLDDGSNCTFLELALMEQYCDLIRLYHEGRGEFGNVDSHQYKLTMYYDISCTNFKNHFAYDTYNYIIEHMSEYDRFNVNEVPGYMDTNLV